MNPILETEGLTKRYHGFTLMDVAMTVPPGSITAVFGPIGAGKTTLMKLLAGQIPKSSGAIRVFGLDYESAEKEIKKRIGYAPQEPAFYKDRSVEFTARFAADFYERWDGGGFYRLLDEGKISPDKKIKVLSRGQKTLLSLALAMSHEANLLVLDEPTAGLDIVLRRMLLERLRAFAAEGENAVIVASHVTDVLEEIAEYVHFLDSGRTRFHIEKDELMTRWKRIHFKAGALPSDLARALIGVRVQPFGNSGLAGDYPSIRERLAAGIAAGDIVVENAPLDEILLAMLKGD